MLRRYTDGIQPPVPSLNNQALNNQALNNKAPNNQHDQGQARCPREISVNASSETFLTAEQAAEVRERFGTPCYVYDQQALESVAQAARSFPAPFGFTLRYAMKANPSIGILKLFRDLGLHVD